jgi:selenium-binding protein 1
VPRHSGALDLDIPGETLAWVALRAADGGRVDALCAVDLDPASARYARVVGRIELPAADDGLHRFGASVRAEHAALDTLVTNEWGTPSPLARGLDPAALLAGGHGARLHVWDRSRGTHRQAIDLGAEQQMVLALRPAHNPTRAYGFANVAFSLDDLSSSVFLWYLDRAADHGSGAWMATKVITIPAQPTDPVLLPSVLRPFGHVPPFATDMALSADDRFLYVSCWGTGELLQYDVSDPFNPVPTGRVRIGGIVARAAHPSAPDAPRRGGPQALAVSGDGRRVYVTSSLHPAWDAELHGVGARGWMAKLDAGRNGGLAFDRRFLVEFAAGACPQQIRLAAGDASPRMR